RCGSAEGDRRTDRDERESSERGLLPCGQRPAVRARDDALDSPVQIRSGDARNAGERRFDEAAARFEDALGIDLGLVAESEDRFVAGAFALVDQSRAGPP